MVFVAIVVYQFPESVSTGETAEQKILDLILLLGIKVTALAPRCGFRQFLHLRQDSIEMH